MPSVQHTAACRGSRPVAKAFGAAVGETYRRGHRLARGRRELAHDAEHRRLQGLARRVRPHRTERDPVAREVRERRSWRSPRRARGPARSGRRTSRRPGSARTARSGAPRSGACSARRAPALPSAGSTLDWCSGERHRHRVVNEHAGCKSFPAASVRQFAVTAPPARPAARPTARPPTASARPIATSGARSRDRSVEPALVRRRGVRLGEDHRRPAQVVREADHDVDRHHDREPAEPGVDRRPEHDHLRHQAGHPWRQPGQRDQEERRARPRRARWSGRSRRSPQPSGRHRSRRPSVTATTAKAPRFMTA